MITLKKDPLVLVLDYGFLVEPMYFKWHISPTETCMIRKSVAEKLVEAAKALPESYNFKIWDGYRTTAVQKQLYDGFFAQKKEKHPDWNEAQLHQATSEFVSPPTTNPLIAAPHNTGGTVDLTIVDRNGMELGMGTVFDHFDVEAHTLHYGNAKIGTPEFSYHKNRMTLFNALTGVGFCNFPEEWWHFSYGDRVWAEHYGKEILYASCEM
ncbi:MAG: M15 family metallopeptidase [Candidatus Peregrinibacteria bacterium]|nr:M15 family metallopeptidase [Candidatus Peregrinibacteria bacterium]